MQKVFFLSLSPSGVNAHLKVNIAWCAVAEINEVLLLKYCTEPTDDQKQHLVYKDKNTELWK